MTGRGKIIVFGISTISAVVMAVVILIFISSVVLKAPIRTVGPAAQEGTWGLSAIGVRSQTSPGYKADDTGNLAGIPQRAEVPRAKTEREIREEMLTAITSTMILKGIVAGLSNKDFYAVIDRGGQKGMWVYEIGDLVEGGLTVADIRRDSVTIERGDFRYVLRLFARSPEGLSIMGKGAAATDGAGRQVPDERRRSVKEPDWTRELRKEGNVILISKDLAERIKADSNLIMSSLAIKIDMDAKGRALGYRVVSVDRGSLAQKMGIMADDTLREVNGHEVKTPDDLQRAYENIHNSTRFDIKVLRKGRTETLQYAIR